LFFRFIYFSLYFFLKNIYFIFKLIIFRCLINLKLYIFLSFIIYRLKCFFIFLGNIFLFKIYTFIYYIKLEFFIYFINENNFFGGLILYIYNIFSYKISNFNNLKNWEFNRLYSSNYLNNLFSRWIFYLKFISNINKKIYLNILYIFYYLFNYIYIFINKYNYFSYFLNYFSYFINYFYLFYGSLLFLKKKYNNIYIYKFFIIIGFFIFFFYDFIYNFILNLIILLNKIVIKLKYIILLYIIYKLGLYNIFCIYIINYINDIEYYIYIYLYNILYLYYSYMEIIFYNLYNSRFNDNLLVLWSLEYKIILQNRYVYFNNTFLSKILYLFEFDFNNLYRWYEKRSLITKDTYTFKKRFIDYIVSFFKSIFNEFYMYFIIIKDYLIYKYIKIYILYIYYFSDINLYFYISKKIIYCIYIIYIYIYSYFKFLYFYILPYYNIIPTIFLHYYFVKFWFIYIHLKFMFNIFLFYFLIIFDYINNIIYLYIILLINIIKLIICYFYNIGLFIFFNIFDLLNLLNIKINIIFFNIYEVLIYLYIKFKLVLFYRELVINYLRLNILNLIYYKHSNYNILGNKVRGLMILNLDVIDFENIKKYKLANLKELRSFQKLGPLVKKFNDCYLYLSDTYIYNNIYYILYFFNNYYLYQFYIYKLFLYFFTNYIIFIYLFICLMFKYFFKINHINNNYNLNFLWKNLKLNFNYNLLNNEKLFLKALDFNRKKNGKRKIIDNTFKLFNYYWTNFKKLKYNKIDYFINTNIININTNINYINFKVNSKLKNYLIEKNMYSNNFYFFYWKNFILDNKNYNFYLSSDSLEFLKFFLSLIFRHNKLAPKIYYYLNNYRQIYFFNNINLNYFNIINVLVYNYYTKLNNIFNLDKYDWIFNKDKYIIWFKDEDAQYNNIYSLNFNISFPKFIFDYFWIGFIIYIFFFRFSWRYSTYQNLFDAHLNFFYIKLLLFNNNFLYLYDVYIYWLNSFLIFDWKNISYEHNDYLIPNREMSKYMPKHRSLNLFVINNDPLYYFKKYYVYSVYNNINNYNTFNVTYYIYNYYYIVSIINYILYIYILYAVRYYFIINKNNKIFLDLIILKNYYKNNLKNYFYNIKKILS
jgi:hypothetical protein